MHAAKATSKPHIDKPNVYLVSSPEVEQRPNSPIWNLSKAKAKAPGIDAFIYEKMKILEGMKSRFREKREIPSS